jgi:hypothetical protein
VQEEAINVLAALATSASAPLSASAAASAVSTNTDAASAMAKTRMMHGSVRRVAWVAALEVFHSHWRPCIRGEKQMMMKKKQAEHFIEKEVEGKVRRRRDHGGI